MQTEKLSALVAQVVRDALIQAETEEASTTPAPSLLTARDVAQRLQTNTQAIYRLARDGKLPPDVVLGTRSYRWTEHTVDQFIERGGIAQRATQERKTLRLAGGRG